MRKVLVCGLIGSGKTEACKVIAAKGFPVYECDSRAKALYTPELVERICKAIGGPIDESIFSDDARRAALRKILYPEVRKDLEKWLSEQTSGVAFIESATAHDAPEFSGFFDEVLEISAPDEVRNRRNPKAALRSASQSRPSSPQTIITNVGTKEQLADRIDVYLKQYEN